MRKMLILLPFIFSACSTWKWYDVDGNNDVIIYEDSVLKIQRSTEIIDKQLTISHMVTKKKNISSGNYIVENLTDSIIKMKSSDSLSFYESCTFKKKWYKKFTDIPPELKSFDSCYSSQIIYYYTLDKFEKKITLETNLSLKIYGRYYMINKSDTLCLNKKYHILQL